MIELKLTDKEAADLKMFFSIVLGEKVPEPSVIYEIVSKLRLSGDLRDVRRQINARLEKVELEERLKVLDEEIEGYGQEATKEVDRVSLGGSHINFWKREGYLK
jgi:hypothetical protein